MIAIDLDEDIDRARFCSNCGTLFIYSSKEDGLDDDSNPFEPCPECGSSGVTDTIDEMSNKLAEYYKSRYEATEKIIDRLSSDKAELVEALEEIDRHLASAYYGEAMVVCDRILSKILGE